jgi:hypothetical protein
VLSKRGFQVEVEVEDVCYGGKTEEDGRGEKEGGSVRVGIW